MPWFKMKVTTEQYVMICAERHSDAVQVVMDKRDFPTSRVIGIQNHGVVVENEVIAEFDKCSLICHAEKCSHAR